MTGSSRPPGAGQVRQGGLFDPRPGPSASGASTGDLGAPGANAPSREVFTVGALTRAIKGTLETRFARVRVQGEISGFRGPHPRGHLFFSLKDADATIEVKVWASVASRLRFRLRDGLSLVIEGAIDVWAPQGRYSLVATSLEPAGEGALALAFQQLKDRLQAEGLFGPQRIRPPRPLPFLPQRIGVVTSRSGAALQDFLRVLLTRNPRMQVLVCDARVQGEGAAEEIARGIARLAHAGVDVIVVTRGGGSVEDLWAFNEEKVARAIHGSPVPVVSAVGHEVDFTISDFVADLRAPTPSAAAERLAPVRTELEQRISALSARLRRSVERGLLLRRGQLGQLTRQLPDPRHTTASARRHLSRAESALSVRMRQLVREHRTRQQLLAERVERQRPQARLVRERAQLSQLESRLIKAMGQRIAGSRRRLQSGRLALVQTSPRARVAQERRRLARHAASLQLGFPNALAARRAALAGLIGRLESVSPLAVLRRGYALAFRARDGALVRGAADVEVGESLELRLAPRGAVGLSDCESLSVQVTAKPVGRTTGGDEQV